MVIFHLVFRFGGVDCAPSTFKNEFSTFCNHNIRDEKLPVQNRKTLPRCHAT